MGNSININLLKQNSSSMQEFSEQMDGEVNQSLEKLDTFNESLGALLQGVKEGNEDIPKKNHGIKVYMII